ncbi:MAG TPA: ADP-glyceromanno-heptose 6-epimerase [Syntrophales bacterium]|jgi:ADP-L-glycero-D-manno-heptose 6-epimerase|nr:ADP-glyceromanno-heptose 6-epimerase [Syntrophales bacterium]HOU76940.1 ADP-glyceromanno-heptose 6-epimerase [Syntrophales bacterium]HPC31709.1 ADP-glyceromanno-heptose 6-epimerase [Syntrophales bacterium]HQG34604.1 ADP-glyceromanno-heptose 6-epimerase [Syntrophales bacterium]HQI36017.1 ADP-glyceromanno-heptose 6-epimerase [Syntrophales bacterium]
MIVVTGGAGFIGSAFIWKLNREGNEDIVVVDRLGTSEKWKNLVNLRYIEYIHKDDFLQMIYADQVPFTVRAVIHMGACSSTTERDADYLWRNNYLYSCRLADWCVRNGIRFIYASSAATYGDGARGFSDDDTVTPTLRPINMYGYSKQVFDLWVRKRGLEKSVTGLKFFNVFGPNEYHKGEMRSVVHKAFGQIREAGRVGLFKSYRPDYPDGGQRRDFVYVKDCVEVLWWLLRNGDVNGIFNVGTGKSRTWNDLMRAVFQALALPVRIDYIDMPPGLEEQYQYFTEAKMDKLAAAGCPVVFRPLEEAVGDYVTGHLLQSDPYLCP